MRGRGSRRNVRAVDTTRWAYIPLIWKWLPRCLLYQPTLWHPSQRHTGTKETPYTIVNRICDLWVNFGVRSARIPQFEHAGGRTREVLTPARCQEPRGSGRKWILRWIRSAEVLRGEFVGYEPPRYGGTRENELEIRGYARQQNPVKYWTPASGFDQCCYTIWFLGFLTRQSRSRRTAIPLITVHVHNIITLKLLQSEYLDIFAPSMKDPRPDPAYIYLVIQRWVLTNGEAVKKWWIRSVKALTLVW